MASYIATLKDDLGKGFSKTQLEHLIGLPKNSLASVLTGKRILSPKSQLKIKRWNESEKPDPLEVEKIEKAVAENNKPENKERILSEKNAVSNAVTTRKNPLTPDEAKHKLWKEGDPKENSMAFQVKYDCANYAELEQKLNP